MNSDTVVDLVRRHIEPHQPSDFKIRVAAIPPRQDEDWWHVVVQPDRPGVRAYEYSERLTRIEDEIREQEGLHVLLVPSLVDD